MGENLHLLVEAGYTPIQQALNEHDIYTDGQNSLYG